MIDHRINSLGTADLIAEYYRKYPLLIITGSRHAKAVYIFGFRVFSKGWVV